MPRHEFVPSHAAEPGLRGFRRCSIGYKQTITWPFVVAFMTEALDPQPTDRVLEIGTGTGYQAAVLSLLVDEVDSIEIIPALGKAAEKRLKRLGYKNVKTKIGDGYLGWPERAPFDKIILTCSPEKIPQPLVDQLKEGGGWSCRWAAAMSRRSPCSRKSRAGSSGRSLLPTLFVPMTGRSDKERTIKPDPLHPEIRNGGFEEREANGPLRRLVLPAAMKANDRDAAEGRVCVPSSTTKSRASGRRPCKAMGIDGSRIASLAVQSEMSRRQNVVDGAQPFEKAGLQVSFHNFRRLMGDVDRHPLRRHSTDWRTANGAVPVPEEARETVIRVGLNGATGPRLADFRRSQQLTNPSAR